LDPPHIDTKKFHEIVGEILREGAAIDDALNLIIANYFCKHDRILQFQDIIMIDSHIGFGRKIGILREICKADQLIKYMNCKMNCKTMECTKHKELERQLSYYKNECLNAEKKKCISDKEINEIIQHIEDVKKIRDAVAHHRASFDEKEGLILQKPKSMTYKQDEKKVDDQLLKNVQDASKNAEEGLFFIANYLLGRESSVH